jgi:hypothetical protein
MVGIEFMRCHAVDGGTDDVRNVIGRDLEPHGAPKLGTPDSV